MRRRPPMVALVSLVSLVVLAAVGGETRAGDRQLPSLKVAVGVNTPDWAPLIVAKQLGLFDRVGVSVDYTVNTGPNTVNLLVSGQVDAAAFTGATAVLVGQQGKATSVVWNNEDYPGLPLVSKKEITSIAALRAASNCRIAMPVQGSAVNYAAIIYKYSLGLKNCTLINVAGFTLAVQGVVSGAYDAAVVANTNAATVLEQGGHVLIDPTSPQYGKTYGRTRFPAGVVYGLTDTLKAKRDGVVRMLRALMGASNYIANRPDADVVAVLQRQPEFQATTVDALVFGLRAVRAFIGVGTVSKTASAGYVSEQTWKKGVEAYAQYGISTFDPKSSAASYRTAVDMSYYKTAFPHVVTVDAEHDTLSKVAAWKLGAASKWRALYTPSKFWFDALNISASKAANAKLAAGTVLWYQ